MFIKISISNYKVIKVTPWIEMFSNFVVYNSKEEVGVPKLIFEIFEYLEESIEFIRTCLDEDFEIENISIQKFETIQELIGDEKISSYSIIKNCTLNAVCFDYNEGNREELIKYFTSLE